MIDVREGRKKVYRFISSLYVLGGFWVLFLNRELVVPYTVAWDKQKVGEGLSILLLPYYAAVLSSIAIFLLIYFLPQLINKVKRKNEKDGPFKRCLYVFVCFSFFLIISSFFSKLRGIACLGPIAWGLCYAGVFGLIEGLNNCETDFSYLDDRALPNEAKFELLKIEYDKWWKGLMLFTTVVIAVMISGTLKWMLSAPTAGEEVVVQKHFLVLGFSLVFYLVPGVAIGIYWCIIKKINAVHRRVREAKSWYSQINR